ncbi:NUDIX domain-containing protein [Aquibium sp. A9E412]|uniref:NUDIX domain-containing protein n=1 Tax=Aquibium sp. A9E412 TaxID=2976767 RepID=UPI0025AF353C|nr:NUDIX domain-containing protein [Aquibium sp. A9E412]MDN2566622.1 NUDIX domain-containing protein [Aquibium sp. A9E412]
MSGAQGGGPRLRVRLFHAWFLLRRPMTLGARAVVHDTRANAVFLVRHTYVPGWQFPGGGVEPGETMAEALERELMEEGNIALTAPPRLVSMHLNRNASRRDHVALYLATAFRQKAPRAPDAEIAECGFFALDRLPEGTTPATHRRLAELFHGASVSPHW